MLFKTTYRMQRHFLFIGLAALAMVGCSNSSNPMIDPVPDNSQSEEQTTATTVEVGKTIPAWQKGQMDVHFINTTTGECMFVIFPDGTQLLFDAASSTVATNSNGSTTNTGIRSRWDPTQTGTRGSQIISDYIKKLMAWTGNSTIDFAVASHMHNDHIGGYSSALPTSANNALGANYRLNGYTEIFDNFKIGKFMDRGYPNYDYPFDMTQLADNDAVCRNYTRAVKWNADNGKFVAEQFKPGVSDQITLKYDASKYPTVKVQNIAVNGEIWTGTGTATTKTFPALADISYENSKSIKSSDNCPPENILSCVLKISYGKFDLFNGADLQYNGRSSFAWKDAELPCAKVAGQVEVMKADHHGSLNTNQPEALKILNPQAIVVNSWLDCQPRTSTLNSMESTLPNCDFFITNFWKDARAEGVDDQVTDAEAARVKGCDGHIVIRVSEGGNQYQIMTLTDSDGLMTVKNVSGPYQCR